LFTDIFVHTDVSVEVEHTAQMPRDDGVISVPVLIGVVPVVDEFEPTTIPPLSVTPVIHDSIFGITYHCQSPTKDDFAILATPL
jgi:hypothetical protein